MRIDLCLCMGAGVGGSGVEETNTYWERDEYRELKLLRGEHPSPHCTDDKTEVQRARISFQRSHGWSETEPGYEFNPFALKPNALSTTIKLEVRNRA